MDFSIIENLNKEEINYMYEQYLNTDETFYVATCWCRKGSLTPPEMCGYHEDSSCVENYTLSPSSSNAYSLCTAFCSRLGLELSTVNTNGTYPTYATCQDLISRYCSVRK